MPRATTRARRAMGKRRYQKNEKTSRLSPVSPGFPPGFPQLPVPGFPGFASANVLAGDNTGWPGKWTAGPGSPMSPVRTPGGMLDFGDQNTATENEAVIAGFGYAQWKQQCQK